MKSKLIVALDVDSYERATGLVRDLAEVVDIYKVGSQLFTRVGPPIIEFITDRGKQVFLDLKFHDIPTTVANAVLSAKALGVSMLTVHAAGGTEVLKAVANVQDRPKVLAVTVLTSVTGDVEAEVLRYARMAWEYGLEGVVASPREVRMLRQAMREEFLVVTPGIRPAWAETGDQKRVMTPAEAVAAGADYIVVGRPIIAADKPAEAAARILAEMSAAGR